MIELVHVSIKVLNFQIDLKGNVNFKLMLKILRFKTF